MNTNKILLGGIVGGVVFFFLGWLIYGMLLADFMEAHSNSCAMRPMEDFIWWAMIASNLASAILLSIVFSWSNITGFAGGLKTGAIIGLLIGLSIDLSFYSMSTTFADMSALVIDILAYTVMTGIAGGVIGWVMTMGKKE